MILTDTDYVEQKLKILEAAVERMEAIELALDKSQRVQAGILLALIRMLPEDLRAEVNANMTEIMQNQNIPRYTPFSSTQH